MRRGRRSSPLLLMRAACILSYIPQPNTHRLSPLSILNDEPKPLRSISDCPALWAWEADTYICSDLEGPIFLCTPRVSIFPLLLTLACYGLYLAAFCLASTSFRFITALLFFRAPSRWACSLARRSWRSRSWVACTPSSLRTRRTYSVSGCNCVSSRLAYVTLSRSSLTVK